MTARLTLRAKLTVVYGALFLVAGLVMLALTWLLVQQSFSGEPQIVSSSVCCTAPTDPAVPVPPSEFEEGGLAYQYTMQVVDATRDEALGALLTRGGIAVLVVAAIAAALAWILAGRMLRPLGSITATARRIADAPDSELRAHERIGLTGPRDEVKELADTFDDMLARLESALTAQRRFVANASHELRTPLTVNRALIELALSRPDAAESTVALGEKLLDVNARNERLIEGLLLLARSEHALGERRFVDLADIVEHVVARDSAAIAAMGDAPPLPAIEVRAEEAPCSGDPVLLEHLVHNLFVNAVAYNLADGGRLELATRTTADGRAELVVSNTGEPLTEAELAELVEPFRRGDERTHDGAGLGLSIVRAIVRAHGGQLVLVPRPGGGLTATVTLPGELYSQLGQVAG